MRLKAPRELLWAIILSLAMFVIFLWPLKYPYGQAPKIASEHEAKDCVSGANPSGCSPSLQVDPSSKPETKSEGEHATEVIILGIKPGEWLLSIVTLMLWGATVRLVRGAEKASAEQSSDMKDSNRVATTAAKSVIVVERAHVYPVVVSPGALEQCIIAALQLKEENTPAPDGARLAFRLKNFGKTPAILKEAFVAFGVPPHGALIGIAFPESVLASLEETRPLYSEMQRGITARQARHINIYTGHVSFEGHIVFDDIWGNEHKTEFYFVWDKDIKSMALHGVKTTTKQNDEKAPIEG